MNGFETYPQNHIRFDFIVFDLKREKIILFFQKKIQHEMMLVFVSNKKGV